MGAFITPYLPNPKERKEKRKKRKKEEKRATDLIIMATDEP